MGATLETPKSLSQSGAFASMVALFLTKVAVRGVVEPGEVHGQLVVVSKLDDSLEFGELSVTVPDEDGHAFSMEDLGLWGEVSPQDLHVSVGGQGVVHV